MEETRHNSEEKFIMDKVYVALSENHTVGRSILSWVLNHFRQDQITIVLVHVWTPQIEVPTPMASELHPAMLEIRKLEDMESAMMSYISDCEAHKFSAEKLVFKRGILDQGLVDLIHQYRVDKLVFGVGKPSERGGWLSNIASTIMNKADPSCNIWFIRDGELLFTRNGCNSTVQEGENNRNLRVDLSDLIQKDLRENYDNNSELLDMETNIPNGSFGTDDKGLLLMYEWEHSSHLKEMRRRKEMEETLVKEKHEKNLLAEENAKLNQTVRSLEIMRDKHSTKVEELSKQTMSFEERIADYDQSSKDLKHDLKLKLEEHDRLANERDKLVTDARKLLKELNLLKSVLCLILLSWIAFWVNYYLVNV